MTIETKYPDYPILLVRTSRYMPGYTVTQPLGIMYLGAMLRQHGYRKVRLLDMRPDRMTTEQLVDIVREFRPRFLGLSSLSYEAPTVTEIIEAVRRIDPTIHICLGGPLPSSMKEDSFETMPADSACIGEGDETVCDLIDRLAEAADAAAKAGKAPSAAVELDSVRGIVYRVDAKVVKTEPREFIQDLDALPNPAWDMVDINQYFRFFGITGFNFFLKYSRYMSVMTSRGCPYRCAYCHNVLGKKFRPRSVDSVMREIHTLAKNHGIREFHLIDDTFNLDLNRAKAILEEIGKMRPRVAIAFPNGVRADRLDEEFMEKAKRAGCYKMNYAVETATPRIQKMIDRNLDIDKVREMITVGDRLGIMGHGYFMIGFPQESEEEMLRTVDFAIRSRLHTANFFIVNPFEGTEIYRMFKEANPDMRPDAGGFSYYSANFSIYTIPAERVQAIVKMAHRRFFFTPWRMMRLGQLMPNKTIFALKGAQRLLFRGFLGKG